MRFFMRGCAILAISTLLLSCNDGGETPTGPVHPPSGIVSDDPAIKDNQLDLVIQPGYFYEDITPQDTVLVKCKVVRENDPTPWKGPDSCSFCNSYPMERNQHMMGLLVRACVDPNYNVALKESAKSVCALRREFTVDPGGTSPTPLVGSVIRFKTSWLGKLVSTGLTTESRYEIRFQLRDLTENRMKINTKLAEKSISAQLQLIAIKGVPVPKLTPGWSTDEVIDEPYAMPIPLTTGHRYEIQLKLELSCVTAKTFAYPPWVSFSRAEYFNTGIPDPGFIKFYDIDIDAGVLN